MFKDGHIHTPFCPHGTKDTLEKYIERALSLGFKEISFTEHAPLPAGFLDPTPEKDSAMTHEDIDKYFEEITRLKSIYQNRIKINAGLEVDYIEGFEKETKNLLNQYGRYLDDSILSVHFLKLGSEYFCLDYSPDIFAKMIASYGTVEKVYLAYFHTLLQSIDSDLGPHKPTRIGHITLVKKFQRKFPVQNDFTKEIFKILDAVQENGYELDYNGAGTAKPLCKEPYPSDWIAKEALKRGIPLVYGSDAHQVKDLGQGLDRLIIE
jgi:histidinol-phosphatase (PHP family)